MIFFKTLPLFSLLIFGGVTHAQNMFRDLSFGDSKPQVIEKLGVSSLNDTSKSKETVKSGRNTLFGAEIGISNSGSVRLSRSSYHIEERVNGLKFTAYFDWKNTTGENALYSISIESQAAEYNKLNVAYKELSTLLIELYGAPKFKKSLPNAEAIFDKNVFEAAAIWFFDDSAVTIGSKLSQAGGLILSIKYLEDQPTITLTK